jgi:hypothetical protein
MLGEREERMRREVYTVISTAGFIAGIFLILIFPGVSRADTLTFQLDYVYNGYSPSGSSPWLTPTFVDKCPNNVDLTMFNKLSNNEFVGGANANNTYVGGGWFFNINPDRPSGLTVSFISGTQANQILIGSC